MNKGRNNTNRKNRTNRNKIKKKTKKLKGGQNNTSAQPPTTAASTRHNTNIKKQRKSITSLKNKKELSGPFNMYYMENKTLNKKIYLFGARHVDKSNSCVPSDNSIKITSLLNQIFYNTEIPIDFFLETLYEDYYTQFKKNGDIYDDFLEDFIFKLEDTSYLENLRFFRYFGCFGKEIKDTIECIKRFPNVRFHYTDWRLDTSSVISQILFSEREINILKILETKFNDVKIETKEKLKIIKEQFDLMNIFVENFKSIVGINAQHILKDFNKIPDTPLYKKIKEGIMESWKNYVEECYIYAKEAILYLDKEKDFIEMLSKTKQNLIINNSTGQDIIKNLFNDKVPYTILDNIKKTFNNIIEIYTLVRLFKKMEKKKDRKHLSDYANNCIIYMGDNHITNIKFFLEKNGFKTKKFSNKKERCIDIENILASGNLFN